MKLPRLSKRTKKSIETNPFSICCVALLMASGWMTIGCSSSGAANLPKGEIGPTATEDGVVVLPENSLRFLKIEEVTPQVGNAILRVPTRVAFRDGAVSRIGAPLPGRVERIHVRTGDHVEAGDPVLTLNCPDAAAIRAALATARAREKEAKEELKRTERMLEQGVGTERERRVAKTALLAARAETARAAATAGFAGGSRGTRIILRAPIDGIVISHSATLGAAVEPGSTPLIEIGDPNELWVIADVFERDLHHLREGASAHVELPSLKEPLAGRIESIGAVVEKDVRTAPVRIDIDERHEFLRPGMFGRARLELPEAGLAVPTAAVLIQDGRQTVVFVQKDKGSFVRRPIVVAQPVEGQVLITSGISAGESVVVKGALLLDGTLEQLL